MMLGLIKSRNHGENMIRPRIWAKCSEMGVFESAAGSHSLLCPSFFGDEDAAFLPGEGGHLSQVSLRTCFSRDGHKVRPVPISQNPSA